MKAGRVSGPCAATDTRRPWLAALRLVAVGVVAVQPCLALPPQVQPERPAPTAQARRFLTEDMIEIRTIPLDEPGCNNQLSPVLVANDPKGGLWVAWGVAGGASYRLQHLADNLSPDRPVVKLNTNALLGLYGHDDGSVAFTWYDGRLTRVFGVDLYLQRMSASGKVLFNTKVRGDPGSGLEYEKRPVGLWYHPDFQGPTVPIAFNGKQYGLFYVVLQKFADKACHTGDEFVAVNANGKVDDRTRSTWNASHSFWQSVVVGYDRSFYGITLADPYPYRAVRIGNYSVHPAKQDVLWPRKPCNNFFPPDTKLSAAFNFGSGFAMAISTAIPSEMEDLKNYDDKTFSDKMAAQGPGAFPVLLLFDKSGKKAKASYITKEPSQDMIITGARLGRLNAVVMWANGPSGMDKGTVFGAYPTKIAVLSDSGRVVQPPIEVKAPLTWHSDAATMSNGDVVWGAIADDWTPVDDAAKLYIVRVHCSRSTPAAPGQ